MKYDLNIYLNCSIKLNDILANFDLVQKNNEILTNSIFLKEFAITNQYELEVIILKNKS